MWLAHSFTLPARNPVLNAKFKIRTEDAADIWWARDTLFLAVADGLASVRMAAAASGLAVAVAKSMTIGDDIFAECQTDQQEYVRFKDLFANVRKEYLRLVADRLEPEEWRTTFAIVAIQSRGGIMVGSMGDATLCISHPGLLGSPPQVCGVIPPSGSHRTHTFDTDIQFAEFRYGAIPSCDGVFLSTDGLDDYWSRDADGRFIVGRRITSCFEPLRAQRYGDINHSFARREHDTKGDDLGVAMAAWG